MNAHDTVLGRKQLYISFTAILFYRKNTAEVKDWKSMLPQN